MADEGGEVPKGKHFYKNKKKKAVKRAKEAAVVAAKTSRLDTATLEYYKRVETTLDENQFEEDEDKTLFVSNVLSVLDGNELKLAKDQVVSRVIEKLLKAANEFQVRVFFDRLSGKYGDMARDRCASHVLQALLAIFPALLQSAGSDETETAEGEGELLSAEQLFLDMCNQLRNEWTDLALHEYGSHVVRVVMATLAGGGVPADVVRSRSSRSYQEFSKTADASKAGEAESFPVPPSFGQTLTMICDTFMASPDLTRDITHPCGSPVLQTLLLVLHKAQPDTCARLVDRLLTYDKFGTSIEADHVRTRLLEDPVGSRLMERLLQVATAGVKSNLYLACFRNHLVELSKHPVANYVVQHMITQIEDRVQQKMLVEELMESMESIIACGSVGVVVRMAQAAANVEAVQKPFVQQLMKTFHIAEPPQRKDVVACVLRLTTYDTYHAEGPGSGKSLPIVLQGSLLLQPVFSFMPSVSDVFASSLLGLGAEGVMVLCVHPEGSHVVEAFLRGAVDIHKKKKLLKMLKGNYVKLATDKVGSHTLEACYASADIKGKETIGEELLEKEQDIRNNIYGRKVWWNCQLEHMKRKRSAWLEKQAANERKLQMFADIIGDDATASPVAKDDEEGGSGEEDGEEPAPDDIDEIFGSKKKKSKKQAKKQAEEAKEHEAAVAKETLADDGKARRRKDKGQIKDESKSAAKKTDSNDIGDVLAAIKESKGKKRKSASTAGDTDKKKGAASEDKASKKKRKFMMS